MDREAAGPNQDLMPGLITVKDVEWVPTFYVLKEECRTLDDGVRHRNIKIAISSTLETRVLTRADAGTWEALSRSDASQLSVRGEPYSGGGALDSSCPP